MVQVMFYLGSILVANLLVVQFGIIRFGPLVFPAGAIAIGFTFSARDFIQQRWGKWGCWIWMIAASLLTYAFNRRIAVASMSAFLIAEGVDWLVFTLVKGNMTKRILWSNLFGLPLDSVVFVVLAFGWVWTAMIGQTIVKLVSSAAVIPLLKIYTPIACKEEVGE